MRLPDDSTAVKVDNGMHVYVTPANGHFPPRVELSGRGRWTPLVPADRIRDAVNDMRANGENDLRAVLGLLDALAPWTQPHQKMTDSE